MDNNIGYLRITSFDENTYKEFEHDAMIVKNKKKKADGKK